MGTKRARGNMQASADRMQASSVTGQNMSRVMPDQGREW